jgi:hypothetical protein
LGEILGEVRYRQTRFLVEECQDGFLIRLSCPEIDFETRVERNYLGRKWHIKRSADLSAVVRTAFLAVMTWQEHETRHLFTYRGAAVFGPHCDVAALVALDRSR